MAVEPPLVFEEAGTEFSLQDGSLEDSAKAMLRRVQQGYNVPCFPEAPTTPDAPQTTILEDPTQFEDFVNDFIKPRVGLGQPSAYPALGHAFWERPHKANSAKMLDITPAPQITGIQVDANTGKLKEREELRKTTSSHGYNLRQRQEADFCFVG